MTVMPNRRTKTSESLPAKANAERLANQAPAVRKIAKELLDELKNLEQYMYWSLDPEEKDGGAYYCQSLIDHAHMVVDQAHEFRAALKAHSRRSLAVLSFGEPEAVWAPIAAGWCGRGRRSRRRGRFWARDHLRVSPTRPAP
jgi:hypothetical protein